VIPKILFGLLRVNYDRLLINNIASQSVVGIYDLGLKASNLGTIFFQSLYNTFLPGFYDQLNKKDPGYRTAVPNFIMKSFAIYILALLSIAFFSFEIFNVTTPKSFHAAINISSIISVTLAFHFIEAIPVLLFLKKTNIVTFLYILTSTIILISGVLFGLNYGIYGFLISNLILSIISTFIYFIVYQKNLRLNWPWKKILIIYFYLLISAGLIIFLRINETEYLIRLIIKLLLLIGLASIILKLKIFIRNDFRFIFDRIKLYIK
jgi:O-antigen/teichoic acid export membrane protein